MFPLMPPARRLIALIISILIIDNRMLEKADIPWGYGEKFSSSSKSLSRKHTIYASDKPLPAQQNCHLNPVKWQGGKSVPAYPVKSVNSRIRSKKPTPIAIPTPTKNGSHFSQVLRERVPVGSSNTQRKPAPPRSWLCSVESF